MRIYGLCFTVALGGLLCVPLPAQPAPPQNKQNKRLLAIGAVRGFQHDSISHALGTLWKLGVETGLWETYIRTDTQLITRKPDRKNNQRGLDYFDAVYFYTTGELDLDEEQKAALLSFVRDEGKGFIGGHTAADCLYNWPAYGDMIGGYFDGHPWNQLVRLNVEDRGFPATAHFPPQIEIKDEIYQFRDYSRDKVRVLMSLDTSSVNLKAAGVRRTDGDFALVWVKNYGKGRVFFNALGHENQVYDRPDIQKMLVEGIKWAMGLASGDASPRPKPAR